MTLHAQPLDSDQAPQDALDSSVSVPKDVHVANIEHQDISQRQQPLPVTLLRISDRKVAHASAQASAVSGHCGMCVRCGKLKAQAARDNSERVR